MKIKTFIENLTSTAKKYIEKYEEYKDLTGEDKKRRLDAIIVEYIEGNIDTIGLNFIAKFFIKNILLQNVPYITQAIFNLIKARIKGITE